MFTPLKFWPLVERRAEAIRELRPAPILSLDTEYSTRTFQPTILGLSDDTRTVSVPWEEGKPYLQELLERFPNTKVLGHNAVNADLPVMAREGIRIPLENTIDTIIYHFLGNSSLCKGSKKTDDDESERKGAGYMNLFAACSMHLAVPNWKKCVGEEQCLLERRPCPEHTPFEYCGNDTYWPLKAFPSMLKRCQIMGTDRLYPLHRDLVAELTVMRDKGIFVDVPYIDKLREEFKADYERIAKMLPFNPNSPSQVRKYFAARGIQLENAQQATIEEACEESDDPELALLRDYGQLGNGVDRWFAPRSFNYEKGKWEGYLDDNGFIHPGLKIFTSSFRLACSAPNFQNLSHRPKPWEKGLDPAMFLANRIRRAIVAPPDHYLLEADYSNAENRVMLHLAGHKVPEGVDLHTWVAEIAEFKPDDPFCLKEGSPRQAAKTVQHGNFYGEGLSLIPEREARNPKIQNEVARGLRILYPEWKFNGMVVSFTGSNFAKRAFGSASYENRKRANEIIERLFGRFPGVRKLQQAISKKVQNERCVRNDLGYCLALYGFDAEKIKIALAFTGQNPIAHATKLAIMNAKGHPNLDCRLQVHDSLMFYIDKRHSPEQAKKWVREAMEIELKELGGLKIPVDVKVGSDWASLRKV